jgi:hypothetical protein
VQIQLEQLQLAQLLGQFGVFITAVARRRYQRYTEAQREFFNAWPREHRAGATFAQRALPGKL